jgi:Tol biopolymer transport system component
MMPSDDRLDSWKEIAAYLKRDVSTVQRWERREGMPVHRQLHEKLGSVFAFRSELDVWASERAQSGAHEPEKVGDLAAVALAQAPPRRHGFVWFGLAAAVLLAVLATFYALDRAEYFWKSPVSRAQFAPLTDFEGDEAAAVISPDGQFVAFLSDRDGQMDVWITQVGTGQFHNLTRGSAPDLVNPAVRSLGFSPDGTLVTFWARKPGATNGNIDIWSVPVLGGPRRPYLEGVAEFDWSRDKSLLVYHTPDPGDPMFVTPSTATMPGRQIFVAPSGVHAHFPLWSRDGALIYFVQGSVPDNMDLWRMSASGRSAERMTFHNSRVSHPVLIDDRTMLYLATAADGSGPWLHSIDLQRRVPHRLSHGVERYTSLAASADGKRLVATVASPKATLWRLPITDIPVGTSVARRINLPTGGGSSPRLGPNYMLYVSKKASGESLWKLADGAVTELWSGAGARIAGGPAISMDGRSLAVSIEQQGRTRLHVMNADGTDARVVSDSLELRGAPAWAPDGDSIAIAALDGDTPRLIRIFLDGRSPIPLTTEYAVDPVWSRDGQRLVYSGADVGTRFPLKMLTATGSALAPPALNLARGARRVCFLPGSRAVVVLKGEIEHKNFWLVDLESGAERQLTDFGRDFIVRDFDLSADGNEIVVDRVQDNSDIVLLDY